MMWRLGSRGAKNCASAQDAAAGYQMNSGVVRILTQGRDVDNTEEQRIISLCTGYGGLELGLGTVGKQGRKEVTDAKV